MALPLIEWQICIGMRARHAKCLLVKFVLLQSIAMALTSNNRSVLTKPLLLARVSTTNETKIGFIFFVFLTTGVPIQRIEIAYVPTTDSEMSSEFRTNEFVPKM